MSLYLKHKSWETRIAAAQAVEAIAKNVRKWSPSSISSTPSPKGSPAPHVDDIKMEDNDETESAKNDIELLSFDKFDIQQVCVPYEQMACVYTTCTCTK